MNNSQNINIKFAKPSDAERIAICHVASWQKIYRGHIPDIVLDNLSVKEREQQWLELLNINVKVLVLEQNHQIIGFASICPSRDEDTDPKKCGEISAIYVYSDRNERCFQHEVEHRFRSYSNTDSGAARTVA